MDIMKASEIGLEIVERARKEKGWLRQDVIWCQTANVSLATLSRFWRGMPVYKECFITICEAVRVDWNEVAVLNFNSRY